MGYYSDVMVSTTKEGYELLKEKCPETFKTYGFTEDVNDEDGVVLGWHWVKWYPEFPEVSSFLETLYEMQDVPWQYLELGEQGEHDVRESDAADELTYKLEVEMHVSFYV